MEPVKIDTETPALDCIHEEGLVFITIGIHTLILVKFCFYVKPLSCTINIWRLVFSLITIIKFSLIKQV